MSTINQIFDNAQWALHAQQLGITVTSHNVANVNTPGYSRQRLILGPARPWTPWPSGGPVPGQVGAGVQAEGIERVYDQFLNVQVLGGVSEQGRLQTRQNAYQQLEAIFASVSEKDLSSDLDSFWSAWEDLSLHPEGSAERVAVQQTGLQLAEKFNVQMEKLQDLQEEMDRSLQLTVEKVNDLTSEIADLNSQIAQAEHSDQNANDLRDMRQQKLEELAELVEIRTWESDTMTTVMGPGGKPLVMGKDSWDLGTKNIGVNQSDIYWSDGQGHEQSLTDWIQSGKIAGYLDMRDERIPDKMDKLDELAGELIWAVNREHAASVGRSPQTQMDGEVSVAAGVSLNDTTDGPPFADRVQSGELHLWVYDASEPPVPQTQVVVNVDPSWTLDQLATEITNQSGGTLTASVGADRTLTIQAVGNQRFAVAQDDSRALAAVGLNAFFTGSTAEDMDIHPAIEQDAALIGAGRVDDDGSLTGTAGRIAAGDNRGALAIAALRDEGMVDDATAEGYYAAIVGELGVEAAGSYNGAEYQDIVVQQLRDQQSSVSGVNLDEEMVNLMKYQWAYQAAAQLIQTGSEMMQTIIELK
jgi:flagellar hook-associated protein 1 FlgK